MLFRTLAAVGSLVTVVLSVGCAAPPAYEPEETDESDDALSRSTCELLDESADRLLNVTLVMGSATLACEAAVLVTTAGTASPACLVPATGTLASWITAALTRGAHTILCSGREMEIELDTSRSGGRDDAEEEEEGAATCEGGEPRTCSDSVHRDLAERKANACNISRSCNRNMPCDELQIRISRNSECLTARRRVTDVCCGGVDGPIHQQERDNVETTLAECQRLLSFCRD